MDETEKDKLEKAKPYWMPDAQGFTMASIILICAICVFWRMTHPSPTDDKLLDMMLTILFSSCLVTIINFSFGSSRGSAAKDATQEKMMERLTPPTGTGPGALPAIIAAAEAAAPAAAAEAAPAAAAAAAPPAADVAVPPAVEAELDRRGIPDKQKD